MRLTLRTLLSYLDDTLEPAQAKAIGAKVAESEQARELIERISLVTRRRRLTTPPTSGPGGMEANTIAEYLDNDVTPEKAAEVEQICLASDVHLAEVAACHQILTLVLGEPALVPPSAKQRMYSLIKGPESIHSRKPVKTHSRADLDLSSDEHDGEQDETLRMGVPAVGGKGGIPRTVWLIAGGGLLAACVFAFAIYQLIHSIPSKNGEIKDPNLIAQVDGKDGPKKIDPPKDDDKDKDKDKDKEKDKPAIKDKPPKEENPPPKKDEKLPEIKAIDVVPEKLVSLPPVTYDVASKKQAPIGEFVAPPVKEPAVLLQSKVDKTSWSRIHGKGAPVFSGKSLLSLPGSKSVIALDSGVEVTLWGNLPELTLDQFHWESRAILHAHDLLDADLTHERGRIILRNKKKGDKDAQVRVRFLNPTQLAEENYFDIVLHPASAVIVERFCSLERTEPFFEDPKDPLRTGPTATMVVLPFAGSSSVRYAGQAPFVMNETSFGIVTWQSRKSRVVTQNSAPPPAWLKGMPPLKDKELLAARETVIGIHNQIARQMDKDDKQIDVVLAELAQVVQDAAAKETLKGKGISGDTYLLWRHALRCSTAIDDPSSLYETFSQDATPLIIRGMCITTLQQWLAQNRDNDYVLLEAVKKNVQKKQASIKIMELFHWVPPEDETKPATYQQLIENLNNDLLAVRALSHWHLVVYLAPAGGAIPYDPAMPRPMREMAVRAWSQLIPPGQLPPQPKAPKKDKG